MLAPADLQSAQVAKYDTFDVFQLLSNEVNATATLRTSLTTFASANYECCLRRLHNSFGKVYCVMKHILQDRGSPSFPLKCARTSSDVPWCFNCGSSQVIPDTQQSCQEILAAAPQDERLTVRRVMRNMPTPENTTLPGEVRATADTSFRMPVV